MAAVFAEVAESIGAEMYFSYQPDNGTSMRLCHWGGLTSDERTLFDTMRYGELLCGRVALHRTPIVVEDIATSAIEGSEAVRVAGYGAYAGFPLLAGSRLLGTVAFITRTKKHFADGELDAIGIVCDQLSAVLLRLQLTDELRREQERFRAIADFTYDWESWIDPGGKVQWVSPSVERFTGVQADECMQMTDYPMPLVHAGDRDRVRAHLSGCAVEHLRRGRDVPDRATRRHGVLGCAVVAAHRRRGRHLARVPHERSRHHVAPAGRSRSPSQ